MVPWLEEFHHCGCSCQPGREGIGRHTAFQLCHRFLQDTPGWVHVPAIVKTGAFAKARVGIGRRLVNRCGNGTA